MTETGPAPATRRRTAPILVVTAVLVVAADAISKAIVVATLSDRPPVRILAGLVYLVELRNAGAAFGLATGMTVVLSVIAVVVAAVIARIAGRLRSVPWAVALGLILGGALGNLADRIFRAPAPFRGAVVDWISLFGPTGHPWPVFNLADSCLVVGVCAVVLLELTGRRFDGRSPQHAAADSAPTDSAPTDSAATDGPPTDGASSDTARRDGA